MSRNAKDDEELLLPTDVEHVERPHKRQSGSSSSLSFKIYVISTMTFLWTGYTLLVRHTRSTVDKEHLYSPPTVVFMAEFIKLGISIGMVFYDNRCSVTHTTSVVKRELVNRPTELLKMSVPSIAYALQNNLDFVALSNLNAAVYQVTTQLKIVTTALFMILFLGRQFSFRRWAAILLLFVGVAAVQLNNIGESSQSSSPDENPFVGLVAVLSTCITAGFAGVYFEKMLKDETNTSLWIRNMQMYICGVISAGIGVIGKDSAHLWSKGFFFGYTTEVCFVIGFLSVGGIYISLVMKYLDNLHKSFASAISIILVVVLSMMFFDGITLGLYFVFGSAIVCSAIILYNSVNE
ncbi:hypothetical protein M3Y94_00441100 [Aphelenchoides besseyi]|nr:hypothetical protein M3Y94_00441100 [Aphelenchoides besseyi]KAI6229396.1 hypothetical protein M3Y95_00526700 [Aphelenchoides besseyi]